MPSLELNEIIVVSMMGIAVAVFAILVVKRKQYLKYLPGFVCFLFTFIGTNVEALVAPDLFNFMEHFCVLLAGILIMLAVAIDFYLVFFKEKGRGAN